MLVDENNLMYRMLEINKELFYAGKQTGGLYGFLQLFCKYINYHKPDHIVVCADKPPYKRSTAFKLYKKDRNPPTPTYNRLDYIKVSRNLIRYMLETMNIRVWEEQGYESDDLIALMVRHYKGVGRIVICSNDDDLYQLLDVNVFLQRSKDVYGLTEFKNEFPTLEPFDWSLVTAMCGSHNGVKNIYKGLGIKTAIKILNDEDKLNKFMKEYGKQYMANVILTSLPFDDDIMANIPRLDSYGFSLRKLENFLMRDCGIQITKAMDDAFSIIGGK
jgi:5'-3' exonuclease